jgi:hypothetical protein
MPASRFGQLITSGPLTCTDAVRQPRSLTASLAKHVPAHAKILRLRQTA